MAAPEDDVLADELRHDVQNAGLAGDLEKGAVAAHALFVDATDMGADQMLRAHAGIVRNDLVEGRAQRRQPLRRQTIARHQHAVAAVARYFLLGQCGHGVALPLAKSDKLATERGRRASGASPLVCLLDLQKLASTSNATGLAPKITRERKFQAFVFKSSVDLKTIFIRDTTTGRCSHI
ncbi:hypothetical protein [Pelagibius sp.]|uniref:hypothetical protein n=1 Tax=Pelagibius sp. TaxID=1931238 RepID=UPI00261E0E90|nr:hypothetical protein [Pelagibius sp.]